MLRRVRVLVTLVLVLLSGAACAGSSGAPESLNDTFAGDRPIASPQYADEASPWTVTSGSLFRSNSEGWTGRPDDGAGQDATGSAVFRMVSKERRYRDLDVHLRLRVDDLIATDRTPAHDYDGAHIWVRYRSEEELYAVSVDRRDGMMVVKKKCPGGPSNGGSYIELSPAVKGWPIPLGRWQQVAVTVRDMSDGSVAISVSRDALQLDVVDRGVGCAPLRSGGVGLRGDNAELRFDDVRVDPH